VAPTTVATEITSLRRAATLEVEDMGPFLAALTHPKVSTLLRHIGARTRRMTTNKRALLLKEVQSFWLSRERESSPDSIRDGFALVVAFFYACRVRELLDMKAEDIEVVRLMDGRDAVRVAFRQTKTRRSAFISHQPFLVSSAHPVVLAALRKFDDVVEWIPQAPVFRRAPRDPAPLSREWFAAVVRRAAPLATPHSCRVGCATELWAAGASIDAVMAVGRWTSPAAALYVVGTVQEQVAATDRLRDGQLAYTPAGLQRPNGTHGQLADLPFASVEHWSAIRRDIPSPGDDEG
jgi:integrase